MECLPASYVFRRIGFYLIRWMSLMHSAAPEQCVIGVPVLSTDKGIGLIAQSYGLELGFGHAEGTDQ